MFTIGIYMTKRILFAMTLLNISNNYGSEIYSNRTDNSIPEYLQSFCYSSRHDLLQQAVRQLNYIDNNHLINDQEKELKAAALRYYINLCRIIDID